MRYLLRPNERRQLRVVERLFYSDDWITLKELSEELRCSIRILKHDFSTLKSTYNDFTIESSYKGYRLVFQKNKGLKTLYNNILEHSISFRLLETIFLNEEKSIFDLADEFFISPSTLYRVVHHINEVSKAYNFQVETSPMRIVGSEKDIRFFFYQYFYEKYTRLDWPYDNVDENAIDNLLYFFIDYIDYPIEFAYFGLFKLTTFVNFIRFKNEHYIDTTDIKMNFKEVIHQFNKEVDAFKFFEKTFKIKIDDFLIQQVFTPYISENYSLTYDRLLNKLPYNKKLKKAYLCLVEILETLSTKNNLPLINKEEVILDLMNAAHMEKQDPRSGYILYDRNEHFVQMIQNHFPHFYEQLNEHLKNYRKHLRLDRSTTGLNFMIYILFTRWDKLVLELRKKFKPIKILIISNRHASHALMIKDFIEYEFSETLIIDVYRDTYISKTILEELEYDLVIANFYLPQLKTKKCLYIENLPIFSDISKIQKEFDEIITQRNTFSIY